MFPAMAGTVGLLLTLAIATAGLAAVYAARETAANGADAAALAAAVATYPPAGNGASPLAAARAAAAGNGSVLVGCECRIDTGMRPRVVTVTTSVEVEVPVLGRVTVRARSRAEFDPLRWLGA
ncbi:MAG: hypothetical protein ACRDVL_00350 [Acidimicrobiia bacterium]